MARTTPSPDSAYKEYVFSLQKPMPRGRYALLASAHVLLLGGLLGVMVWSGFNYLLPVGAFAYLAGIGTLASLVAITIRRMREAGMPFCLLLAPFVCGAAFLLTGVATLWVMAATPIDGSLTLPIPPPLITIPFVAVSIILTALAAGLLFTRALLTPHRAIPHLQPAAELPPSGRGGASRKPRDCKRLMVSL